MEHKNGTDVDMEMEHKRQARHFFSGIGFGMLTLVAVTQLGSVLLAYVTQWTFSDLTRHWCYAWLLSFIPLYGMGVPALLLALKRVPGVSLEDRTHDRRAAPRLWLGWWGMCLLILLGFAYIGSMVGNWTLVGLSALTDKEYTNSMTELVGKTPFWAELLLTVVVAPIAEEFLFRKVFMDRIRRYGDIAAILISATFFALFHGNLHQVFYAFLAGTVLGYAYARTGKMRWNISLHMAFNLLGGIVLPYLMSLGDGLGQRIAMPFVYALMVASVPLALVIVRKTKFRKNQIPMSRDSLFSATLGAPGIAVAWGCCMVLLLLNVLSSGT